MPLHGFSQLPPNREHRVQRRHRLLEDHSYPVAPDVAHGLLGLVEQVVAQKLY